MAETDDETEPLWLPEVLIEKIVAEIPFPHILNARLLSKEWKWKFSRVVRQASTRWVEYYPALVSRGRVEAYNAALNCTARTGSKNLKATGPDALVAGSGTLLVSLDINVVPPRARVMNLLTGQKRKILCPKWPPSRTYCSSPWPILTPMGTDHYELVMPYTGTEGFKFDLDPPGWWISDKQITGVNVYNSSSQTWRQKSFNGDYSRISRFCAYMDGSLYCIADMECIDSIGWHYVRGPEYRPRIMRFNAQDGTTTEIKQIELHDKVHGKWLDSAVVRCGSRIIVAMFEQNLLQRCSHVKIFQLDIGSSALMELSTFPLELLESPSSYRFCISVVASSSTIYILQRDEHILTAYDVNSKTWTSTSSVPDKFFYTLHGREMRCFVFEPSFNPFVVP